MIDQSTNLILKAIDDFKVENQRGHTQIIERLDRTNGNVMENTAFRLKTTGALTIMKFLLGFVGLGTIINIIILLTR